MQVAQPGESIRVARIDLQDLVVDFLGPVEVQHLAIRVGDPGEHRHVAVALVQVLLPDLDGPVELLQGPVAVRQPDEGVLVSLVMREAVLVVADGLVVGLALARRVPHAHEGVVVLRLHFEDAAEVLLRLRNVVLLEELVAPLGKLGYRRRDGRGRLLLVAHCIFDFPSASHCFITMCDFFHHRGDLVRSGGQPVRLQGLERLSPLGVVVSYSDQSIGILRGDEYPLCEAELTLIEQLVALSNERRSLLASEWRWFLARYLQKAA